MTATVYAVMPFVLVLVAALSCFLVCTHLAASLQSACAELKILAERLTAKVHLEPDVSELKIRMGRLERLMARHQEINCTCNIMSFNFKRHNITYEILKRHIYVSKIVRHFYVTILKIMSFYFLFDIIMNC